MRLNIRIGILLLLGFIAVVFTALPSAADPTPTRITVAAAGDVLIHSPIFKAAYNSRSGSYDFDPVFTPVAPYLESADYTIANLETRLAGEKRGYSGYPRFNSPAELADALKTAGINLLATANNHCMDMGWPGIVATLDNLDAAGMPHIGTYRTAEEQASPFLVDVKGIKLAFVNYTFGTNGIPVPAGKGFAVNVINTQQIIAEAKAARELGADLVIAVLHFGVEYQRAPNAEQRRIAATLAQNGIDVIIGAHPHVVQPIEYIPVKRDGATVNIPVAYSLGNFVSNQREQYRDSGIILYLDIEKTSTATMVSSVRYLPVWVERRPVGGHSQYRVLPVNPSITPVTDIKPGSVDTARMKAVWQEMNALLTSQKWNILPAQFGGRSVP